MSRASLKTEARCARRRGAAFFIAALAVLAAGSLVLPLPRALAPWGPAPAAAVAPAQGTPPLAVPHPGMPSTVAQDAAESALAASPAWKSFREAAGKDWSARANPITGAPHRAWGSGFAFAPGPVADVSAAEARAREFVSAEAQLLACEPRDLALLKATDRGGRFIVVFQQTHGGVPVEGGRVDVRLDARGRVTLFGSDFFPGVDVSPVPALSAFAAAARARAEVGFDPATDTERSVELRILPIQRGRDLDYRLAWRVVHFLPEAPALWVSYVDAASGRTLWRFDDLRYETVSGTAEGDVQIETPDDPFESRAFPHLRVAVTGQGADTTGADGAFSITVPGPGTYEVTAQLRGRYVDVNNQAGPDASFADSAATGVPFLLRWDAANAQADERDSYFHVLVAHDSLKSWDPAQTGGDYVVPCAVSIDATCNAFWDGLGVNFYAAGDGCANTGQMPDVIYHEYGHGVSQWVYSPASTPGDMGEGFSDFYACTLNDQPLVGRGFFGPGTHLRTLDNQYIYPDSINGEVHHDGLIIGGALWHMRERFINSMGDHTTAVALADSLFHYARYGMAQNFQDYFTDLLMEDDDDGDLGNGTPHGIDIYQAFGQHGIGPGLYLAVAHDSLKDTEAAGVPVTVEAAITSCLPLRSDSLLVYYRTRSAGGGPWSGYAALTLAPTATPHLYRAAIPGQPDSTAVQYYVVAESDTLDLTTLVPPEGAAAPYAFFVGPDVIAPAIAYLPLYNQILGDWPPTLTATVTDNAALASVVLETKRNGTPQPPVPMTPTGTNDQWQATFPGGGAVGDFWEYRVVATDGASAPNTATLPALGGYYAIYIGPTLTLLDETVESGSPGWTHYVVTAGFRDQWHISTNRNHTPGGSHSWKCGAQTALGRYQNSLDAGLETPPIALGDHTQLRFWHWMRAEEGSATTAWDGGILEISLDAGASWQQLTPTSGGYTHTIIANPDSPFEGGTPCWSGVINWSEVVVDLAGYHGTARFRFRFGSDAATTDLGWHVDDILVTAAGTATSVELEPGGALPRAYALEANRPNPFNPDTEIRFALPAAGPVRLAVYDVGGREVRRLVDGPLPAGEHRAHWDGRNDRGEPAASGIYFYRLEAGEFRATRKMTLLK